MKSSFRWYGEDDPVTLEQIRQIPGMRSIVSAVYDVAPGEVWPRESLQYIADQCAAHGLVFDVVESIPVTEDVKLGGPTGAPPGKLLRKHPPLCRGGRKMRHLQLYARL